MVFTIRAIGIDRAYNLSVPFLFTFYTGQDLYNILDIQV